VKYFSLFSGIGGLDFGLSKIADCIGYSEIKNSSIKIYNKNNPGHKNFGDINKIDFKGLPDFDILTGGFPCQSFSLAGAREGFKDRRGQMIFRIYDLLTEKKPMYAVLENVKGLLDYNEGKTYKSVIKLLSSAGYFVRVVLINSMHHGSAQSRERIFFLCSRDGEFPRVNPEVMDNTKLFKDVRDKNVSYFKEVKRTPRNYYKVEQKRKDFNFELIGDYDRVGTLITQLGCGEKVVGFGDWVRILTTLECERLQGFPEGWTEGVSEADRYFALGNAVNCNVSDYLFGNYLKKIWSGFVNL